MKKNFLLIAMLIAASFLLIACGDTTGGNTAAPDNSAPENTAPETTSAADVEAELKKDMETTGAALLKNDTETLANQWSDDYMVVMPDGKVYTKTERLEVFKSGEVKYEKFDISDMKARTLGNDSAVSISTIDVKGTNKGKPFEGSWRLTAVHRKTGDGWKSVSSQLTSIGPPPADMPAKPAAEPAKPAEAPAKPSEANKAGEANKPVDTGDTH